MAHAGMHIELAPVPGVARAPVRAAGTTRSTRRWLFGPWVDFLALGGGSFVVFALLAAFFPRDESSRVALGGVMLFLAHFVNHPHFAHSYQIFYEGFVRKAFPKTGTPAAGGGGLAARYRFAGIMVPAVLAAFFVIAIAQGSAPLLGLAANVMFFMVGWHYAKQGYGILMLDAAFKSVRFGAGERRRLLWNTHLTWVTYWLLANDALKEREFWGLTYYLLDVPDPLLFAMVGLTAVSTLSVGRDLFSRWRTERTLPLNGLVAYVAAVYVWLAVGRLDPVLLLVVPAFHSLQYLAVVWRYQLNVEGARGASAAAHANGVRAEGPDVRGLDAGGATAFWSEFKAWLGSAPGLLARFAAAGTVLGFFGFWFAPVVLDVVSGYERAVFGTTLFLFIGWTFINIHHYFIDNVIWRRENPETRRHLFGA